MANLWEPTHVIIHNSKHALPGHRWPVVTTMAEVRPVHVDTPSSDGPEYKHEGIKYGPTRSLETMIAQAKKKGLPVFDHRDKTLDQLDLHAIHNQVPPRLPPGFNIKEQIQAVVEGSSVREVVERLLQLTEIGMGMRMNPPAVARPYRLVTDEDRKHAGWIEPNGRTHTLGPDEIHGSWAEDRPELWPAPALRSLQKANARGDDTYDHLARQMGRMLKQGWIRKAAKDMYHVHDRAHVSRVLQHVRRWHPDVKEFAVDIGPRANTSLTIDTGTGWPVRR